MSLSNIDCTLVEVFKIVNNQNPSCLDGIFQINQSSYSLRDPLRLHQPKCNSTNYGLRTFSYTGAKLWNDFPSHIKHDNDDDLKLFKAKLKEWNGPSNTNTGFNYV